MLNQHEEFQFWIAKSNNLDSVYKNKKQKTLEKKTSENCANDREA